jgi:hypothetical protein
LSQLPGASSTWIEKDGFQICKYIEYNLSRTAGDGQSSILGFGWKLTAPYLKGTNILRIVSHALHLGRALWIDLYVWEEDAEENI